MALNRHQQAMLGQPRWRVDEAYAGWHPTTRVGDIGGFEPAQHGCRRSS